MIVYWVGLSCSMPMTDWAAKSSSSYQYFANNSIRKAIDLIQKYKI